MVTIEKNDVWNGRIGFAASSGKALLDEDGAGSVTLNLTRYNAFFGRTKVFLIFLLKLHFIISFKIEPL